MHAPWPRESVRLSRRIHQHLHTYMLCGTAAGIGVLAQPPAAECKIVYTPAHVGITGVYDLDLNHDKTTDFTIVFTRTSSNDGFCPGAGIIDELLAKPGQKENGVAAQDAFALALSKGASIGSGDDFSTRGAETMALHRYGWFPRGDRCKQVNSVFGDWPNVTDRYLGLKFLIHGKTHYGWARLNVSTSQGISATLTGYAYETIPDKPIIAGKTQGPDAVIAPEHPAIAGLGYLAAGKK
jgi:hypothetical protein